MGVNPAQKIRICEFIRLASSYIHCDIIKSHSSEILVNIHFRKCPTSITKLRFELSTLKKFSQATGSHRSQLPRMTAEHLKITRAAELKQLSVHAQFVFTKLKFARRVKLS